MRSVGCWRRLFAGAVLWAAGLSLPLPALAWGVQGHRLVAEIAQDQLSGSARARVQALLATEGLSALADIAFWADEHRNPATAPWHYINFPRDSCVYVAERDCPDGRCVVQAITRQTEALARASDTAQALTALKYLVHLVADVHQPLHAGYQDDRGGNSYQLQAFMLGSNLHALWDSGIIHHLDDTDLHWRSRVRQLATRESGRAANAPLWTPAQAASRSCTLVGQPGFYPPRRVGLDYIDAQSPLLEQQLALAARSLADLLNRIWP